MSAVTIIRSLLTASTNLTAAVPATRIMAGVLPQGTAVPAISITEISRQDRQLLKSQAYNRSTGRVQVTVMASTYPQQKQILALVRKACRDQIGTIAGITGATVLLDGTGPDFQDFDNGFYMQSQDFWESFIEST